MAETCLSDDDGFNDVVFKSNDSLDIQCNNILKNKNNDKNSYNNKNEKIEKKAKETHFVINNINKFDIHNMLVYNSNINNHCNIDNHYIPIPNICKQNSINAKLNLFDRDNNLGILYNVFAIMLLSMLLLIK